MNTAASRPVPEAGLEVVLVPGLPAEVLDERLRIASRHADVGHRAMAFYLADLHDRGLCKALGAPTTVTYAVRELGTSRRQARELLQAGLRLRELQIIDAAFAEGRISWSRVRRLCQVATADTEQEWLDRARRCSQDDLDAQVRRARPGDRPAEAGGLPGARFAVRVQFDALQWQMWENARSKLVAELRAGAGEVRDEDLMLEMMRLVLASDADGTVPGRQPVDGGAYKIVVQAPSEDTPPEVMTEAGREPLDTDAFERVASNAAVPPKLRARILARDGHACSNCGSRRDLQIHHVIWRSRGGPTREDNLGVLCGVCHGMVHDGFLDVEVAQCAAPGRDGRESRGGERTALVFRDCHGRVLGRRVLGGARIVMRPNGEVAQCAGGVTRGDEVAQCAGEVARGNEKLVRGVGEVTPGAGRHDAPPQLDRKWLARHLGWFDARGGKLVLKARYRDAFDRMFRTGTGDPRAGEVA